jgi:hypothetical protein
MQDHKYRAICINVLVIIRLAPTSEVNALQPGILELGGYIWVPGNIYVGDVAHGGKGEKESMAA